MTWSNAGLLSWLRVRDDQRRTISAVGVCVARAGPLRRKRLCHFVHRRSRVLIELERNVARPGWDINQTKVLVSAQPSSA